MNKKTIKKVLLVVALVLVVALSVSIGSFRSRGEATDAEGTLKSFLTLMDNGEYSKIIDGCMVLWAPFDPLNRAGNSGKMTDLSKAEAIGLDKVSSTPEEIRNFHIQLLEDEANTIKRIFGEDAFKNVTFTKDRNDGVLDYVWVDTRTGNEITYKEAEQISSDFWNKIFIDNGFTEAELNEIITASRNKTLTEELKEKMLKLNQLTTENIDRCPVKEKQVTTEGYIYHLSFGPEESDKDYHNFFVRIEYRNGKWVTLGGIEMTAPEVENHGD